MRTPKSTLSAILFSIAIAGAQTTTTPATPTVPATPAPVPPARPVPAHSSISVATQVVAIPSDTGHKCKRGSDDTTYTAKVVLGLDAQGEGTVKIYAIVDYTKATCFTVLPGGRLVPDEPRIKVPVLLCEQVISGTQKPKPVVVSLVRMDCCCRAMNKVRPKLLGWTATLTSKDKILCTANSAPLQQKIEKQIAEGNVHAAIRSFRAKVQDDK